MNQVFSFSALRTVPRYQNEGLRHYFTKNLALFRIGGTYYSSDIAVTVTHVVFAPLSNLLTYHLIQRFSIDQLILKLTAGWVGSLYKDEETFLLLFADINERFHTVRSQIWINRGKILVKACIGFASYMHLSKMAGCISCRSGTDVTTFNITDHYQIFGFTVVYSFLICFQALDAKLLVHGMLRHIRKHRVKSYHDRCLCFLNLVDQFVNHGNLLLWS